MYSIANERNMNITYLVGNVFKDFNIKKNDKYQIQESQIEFFNLVFHEIFFEFFPEDYWMITYFPPIICLLTHSYFFDDNEERMVQIRQTYNLNKKEINDYKDLLLEKSIDNSTFDSSTDIYEKNDISIIAEKSISPTFVDNKYLFNKRIKKLAEYVVLYIKSNNFLYYINNNPININEFYYLIIRICQKVLSCFLNSNPNFIKLGFFESNILKIKNELFSYKISQYEKNLLNDFVVCYKEFQAFVPIINNYCIEFLYYNKKKTDNIQKSPLIEFELKGDFLIKMTCSEDLFKKFFFNEIEIFFEKEKKSFYVQNIKYINKKLNLLNFMEENNSISIIEALTNFDKNNNIQKQKDLRTILLSISLSKEDSQYSRQYLLNNLITEYIL